MNKVSSKQNMDVYILGRRFMAKGIEFYDGHDNVVITTSEIAKGQRKTLIKRKILSKLTQGLHLTVKKRTLYIGTDNKHNCIMFE